MSTQFEISNNGQLDLKDVRIVAFEIRVEDMIYNLRQRNIAHGYTPPAKILVVGETETVPFQAVVATNIPLTYADIALIAFFKPAYMPFWRRRAAFRFVTVRQANGELRLQEQPTSDALAQYDRTIEESRRHFPGQNFEP